MHSNQQVGDMAVEALAPQTEALAERTGELFEGALKAEEKSTSAEGRLSREDIASARTSSKKEYECTQEWWEGYDPGMDGGF